MQPESFSQSVACCFMHGKLIIAHVGTFVILKNDLMFALAICKVLFPIREKENLNNHDPRSKSLGVRYDVGPLYQ